MSGSTEKTAESPSRIRSWSSTRRTVMVTASPWHASGPGATPRAGRGVQPHDDGGAVRGDRDELEVGVDERGAFAHDRETVGVGTTRFQADAVVLDDDLRP